MTDTPERRSRRFAVPMMVGTALVALVGGGLWVQRAPLAEGFINRTLAERGLTMRYRVVSIGPRTQRIENVVLGDPARPDLTARWMEVDIALLGFSPSVAAIRAGGVRLRGDYRAGKLTLGQIDRFITGEGSDGPVLPDLVVGLTDARAAIATDFGWVGLAVDGQGNMRSGFAGRGAAVMPRAQVAGCLVDAATVKATIATLAGRARIDGPLSAKALACANGGHSMKGASGRYTAHFDERLSAVDGSVELTGSGLRSPGMGEAAHAAVKARFSGPFEQLSVDGALSLADVRPAAADPLRRARMATERTPFAPLLASLASAMEQAGRSNSAEAAFAIRRGDGGTRLDVTGLRFASASGARIAADPAMRVTLEPGRDLRITDGAIRFGGGGLPTGTVQAQLLDGGRWTSRIDLSPYAAGNGRLALGPIVLRGNGLGTTGFATVMTLDGPLGDGAVAGLSVPLTGSLDANGRLVLNRDCFAAGWQGLRLGSFTLGPARLQLCTAGGAGSGVLVWSAEDGLSGGIAGQKSVITGRSGSGPVRLSLSSFQAGLGGGGLRLSAPEITFGDGERAVILRARRIAGRADKAGLSGRIESGLAQIGTVPLLLSQIDADWRFAGGRLALNGATRITDRAADVRFNAVRSDDMQLLFDGERITASGHIRHATRGAPFARVDILHRLAPGTGEARFALDNLEFGPQLQPDDLTPIALGVVANVEGMVEGGGVISWDDTGVRSSGRFSTKDTNLAAAFGPVRGLSTSIQFTDLLALETAPGQVATVESINPGVEVRDGVIRFQLLRNKTARIEHGRWPFSGGDLILLPGTLDFDARQARNLTFRVVGLDAGAFINTMALKNVSATGVYDGLFPMTFDASGGRIAGGILVARQNGSPPLLIEDARTLVAPCDPKRQAGELSYVGAVSNADMNAYGKMAFDALKHLRYRCLTILLDGALDGEFVTRLAINGINQGSDEARKSFLLRPFLGLPFIFNVRIEAPFRGLLNTYQSFVDPSALIRNSLGAQYQSVLNNGLAVQPPDSDKALSKEGE